MSKTFIAIAATLAFAAATPVFAKEAEKTRFTHEGITYTYTLSKAGKSTIIEGSATPGQKFRFVKSGKRVTGVANGVPVSFRTDELAEYRPSDVIPLASR